MANFQSLPGFREFYPEDCAARNGLFQAWRDAARRFGFSEYDAPVLEPLELFTEKSGDEIRSQLFEFKDKGDRQVALRPEMTPSLARLVAARAGSLRKPIKWFSIGEQFRYEKPQKGRLRSFYQFNADILGEPGPAADAECIALLVESLKASGLKNDEFVIYVSDRKIWSLTLESLFRKLDVVFTEGSVVAVFLILDKWSKEDAKVIKEKLAKFFGSRAEEAYQALNRFFEIRTGAELIKYQTSEFSEQQNEAYSQRAQEWHELINRFKAMGLESNCEINYSIVRGLAYYTGFVFEAYQKGGAGRALAGGGRYDNLIQKLGGPEMPAVGFAIGDVTVTDLLQELKRPLGKVEGPDAYIVIGGGEKEKATALELIGKLRAAGLSVDYPLKEAGFGKQFKAADQCGARLAIVVGEDEVAKGQVKIQDMKSGGDTAIANDAELATHVIKIMEEMKFKDQKIYVGPMDQIREVMDKINKPPSSG